SPILRVSEKGGATTQVTRIDVQRGQLGHRWPAWVDDRRFVFAVQAISSEAGGIYLGTIDSTSVTRLADPYSNTVFVGGRLLYVVDGMVVARSLDAERARLTDEAIEVAGPVAFAGALGFGAFSASTTGMMAYASGGAFAASRVSWVDRGGKTLGEFAA